MSLLAAIDELETLLKSDAGISNWLKQYGVSNKPLQVHRTNRKVEEINDRYLPCVILELPDGEFGQRHMGAVAQGFNHELDLVFAISVDSRHYQHAFDARIQLVDQVLPALFLKQHRLANYIDDVKLLRFETDSGVHFPKVFVQATISISGNVKRD